jgi:DNA-binding MarR family transcriptional regulator
MANEIRLANEAWEALFRAQATFVREFTESDAWGDLPPRDYGVLYALSTAPDGLRISELCDDVLLTQPGMSRLIARLEKNGLVERREDPDDGRASRIRLTPAGVETQRGIGMIHARHVAQVMTRALDQKQLEQLRELSLALVAGAERAANVNPKNREGIPA